MFWWMWWHSQINKHLSIIALVSEILKFAFHIKAFLHICCIYNKYDHNNNILALLDCWKKFSSQNHHISKNIYNQFGQRQNQKTNNIYRCCFIVQYNGSNETKRTLFKLLKIFIFIVCFTLFVLLMKDIWEKFRSVQNLFHIRQSSYSVCLFRLNRRWYFKKKLKCKYLHQQHLQLNQPHQESDLIKKLIKHKLQHLI